MDESSNNDLIPTISQQNLQVILENMSQASRNRANFHPKLQSSLLIIKKNKNEKQFDFLKNKIKVSRMDDANLLNRRHNFFENIIPQSLSLNQLKQLKSDKTLDADEVHKFNQVIPHNMRPSISISGFSSGSTATQAPKKNNLVLFCNDFVSNSGQCFINRKTSTLTLHELSQSSANHIQFKKKYNQSS